MSFSVLSIPFFVSSILIYLSISRIVCFLLYLYSHLFLSLILHFYFSVCLSFHSLPFLISVIHPFLFISLFISSLSLYSSVLSCHSSSPFNFCVCFSLRVAADLSGKSGMRRSRFECREDQSSQLDEALKNDQS